MTFIRLFKILLILITLMSVVIAAKNEYGEHNVNRQADVSPLSFLKVQGDKIVNSSGQEVYLRGFQGLGFFPIEFDLYMTAIHDKKQDPYIFDEYATDLAKYTITDLDIQEIKSTGANVVRIWINLDEVQKRPYEYSESVMLLMEETVNRFGREGIYVIPLLGHAGQNDFENNKWYEARGLSLWKKETGLWDQTAKLWGVLAERFKDNPYIAGYNVINEPKAPSRQALHEYYEDVIFEIRKNDPRHIIILEVDWDKEIEYQIGGNYSDSNIMASFHYYRPHDFTLNPEISNLSYPGRYCAQKSRNCTPRNWNKENMKKEMELALNLEDLKGMPVYVGEFGAHAIRDPDGLRWIEDMLSVLNENGLHYTYHNYKHRHFHGYWIRRPEAERALRDVIQKLVDGDMEFSDVTEEQKMLLSTEEGYYQRPKIKSILRKYFTAR